MRKDVTLLLFLALSSMLHAQETSESVLQDGVVWKMECQTVTPPEYPPRNYYYRYFTLSGDTLIDDIPFKRVHTYSTTDENLPGWKPSYYWIGEKDSKLYYWKYSYKDLTYYRHLPFMDFSLKAGDRFMTYVQDPYDDEQEIWEHTEYEVIAVSDTILPTSTDKRTRRCIYVQSARWPDNKDCWVEGIGSLKDGVTSTDDHYGTRMQLVKCSQAEDVLFADGGMSGTAGIGVTDRTNTREANIVFDLQGRRIAGTPRKGVYVRDGRKYVAK